MPKRRMRMIETIAKTARAPAAAPTDRKHQELYQIDAHLNHVSEMIA